MVMSHWICVDGFLYVKTLSRIVISGHCVLEIWTSNGNINEMGGKPTFVRNWAPTCADLSYDHQITCQDWRTNNHDCKCSPACTYRLHKYFCNPWDILSAKSKVIRRTFKIFTGHFTLHITKNISNAHFQSTGNFFWRSKSLQLSSDILKIVRHDQRVLWNLHLLNNAGTIQQGCTNLQSTCYYIGWLCV